MEALVLIIGLVCLVGFIAYNLRDTSNNLFTSITKFSEKTLNPVNLNEVSDDLFYSSMSDENLDMFIRLQNRQFERATGINKPLILQRTSKALAEKQRRKR